MSRLPAIFMSTALLTACAAPGGFYGPEPRPTGPYYGAPGGTPVGPEATYQCDDLTTVLVQPGIGVAMATLNSGMQLRLPQHAPGLFGVEAYRFQVRGPDALWSVPERAAVLCHVKR